MSIEYMAGGGYSDTFASSPDELDKDKRHWWCPSCGAVFRRHHNESTYKFCNNCDQRDAVHIECKPVGPGAAEFGGNNAE